MRLINASGKRVATDKQEADKQEADKQVADKQVADDRETDKQEFTFRFDIVLFWI